MNQFSILTFETNLIDLELALNNISKNSVSSSSSDSFEPKKLKNTRTTTNNKKLRNKNTKSTKTLMSSSSDSYEEPKFIYTNNKKSITANTKLVCSFNIVFHWY